MEKIKPMFLHLSTFASSPPAAFPIKAGPPAGGGGEDKVDGRLWKHGFCVIISLREFV